MSKQTYISGSSFGGNWTKQKLIVIQQYLHFYTQALKNKKFKLIYIDAFAGSGKAKINNGLELEGSPLIALNYNFHEYYFLELNKERIENLRESVRKFFPTKIDRIHFINGDCNVELIKILNKLDCKTRGVMFLDPYALELEWKILEAAQNTHVLDVWYLFPLNALVRCLPNERLAEIPDCDILDKILGSNEWKSRLYYEDKQMSLFEDHNYIRVDFNSVLKYIKEKLEKCFAYVSPVSQILKNEKQSPLFILFFLMTNKNKRAIELGDKVASQILRKIDKRSII